MLGSGTEFDPYIIQNVTDLQNVNNDLDAWYELGGDIDASETSGWNGGAGFVPLGTGYSGAFYGKFDGKDHKISNLYINRPSTNYIGLFGSVYGGTVKNVGLEGGSVTGQYYVGSLIGALFDDATLGPVVPFVVQDCWSTVATVTGQYVIGGLVGRLEADYASNSTFTRNWCSCNVVGTRSSATENIGGLIAETFFSSAITISKCFSTGTVTGTTTAGKDAGGLIGTVNAETTIQNCYAKGNVTVYGASSSSGIGGFMSNGAQSNLVDKSYSIGNVTGGLYPGGFCGNGTPGDIAQVTNCYWDTEASGNATSRGGTGKITVEMKTKNTFIGWDFTAVWSLMPTINGGYP